MEKFEEKEKNDSFYTFGPAMENVDGDGSDGGCGCRLAPKRWRFHGRRLLPRAIFMVT